jgi:hypothetical protein
VDSLVARGFRHNPTPHFSTDCKGKRTTRDAQHVGASDWAALTAAPTMAILSLVEITSMALPCKGLILIMSRK